MYLDYQIPVTEKTKENAIVECSTIRYPLLTSTVRYPLLSLRAKGERGRYAPKRLFLYLPITF